MKSNSDISNLFEHVTLSIRATRTELITDGKEGVVVIQRDVDLDLSSGRVSAGPTRGAAIAISDSGSSARALTSSSGSSSATVRAPPGGRPHIPEEARTQRKPVTTSSSSSKKSSLSSHSSHSSSSHSTDHGSGHSSSHSSGYSSGHRSGGSSGPSGVAVVYAVPVSAGGGGGGSGHESSGGYKILTNKDAKWILPSTRKACQACKTAFGMFSAWRHNCRLCGDVFCSSCSADTSIPVAHGKEIVERCCVNCRRAMS